MALFKILKGNSARIDTSITPFHDGYAYFTPDDGGFYIDSDDGGVQRRIRVNPTTGGGASSAVYATLRSNGWENGEQRVSVAGLTAEQNGVIGVTHDISDEQLTACENGGLYICEQGAGYLKIALRGDTPACDIPVVVILLG